MSVSEAHFSNSPHPINVSQPVQTNPQLAIALEGVTVAYRSYKERPTSLKESIIKVMRDRQFRHYSTFNALSDISFSVKKGEVLAIIGGNGSGKSTLLKVLAKVLKPISGSVSIKGSVSSLIELGAGFDPELNAIENIYLNGSLHKKSRSELRSRIPAILDFAELGDFSTTPIKYYSSGMYARLGFSVAVDIDPDLLLVDEILSVGDERFQKKCTGVFRRFIGEGKTIVMVSHDLNLVQEIANSAILLSRGEIVMRGTPQQCVEKYREDEYQSSLG